MYINKARIKPLQKHVWLATPTPHPEMLEYVREAYKLNWLSTEGKNIKEVERITAELIGVKYAVGLSCCTVALHLCVKLAGERLYGKPPIGVGSLCQHRVITA